MRLVRRDLLDAFMQKHADSRSWVAAWIIEVEAATWKTPHDIKARYMSASFLPSNVIIFNVKGNAYRIEVQIAYKTGVVAITWAGTHAEYSKR